MAQRLKQSDFTIVGIYRLSHQAYRSKKFKLDNKQRRMRLDVVSGKIIGRSNLSYNKETKVWEQTGREIKIVVLVRTVPKSYKANLNVKHMYPVTFLIRDFEKGIKSSFRWRTGSFKRPLFAKKGAKPKQRKKLEEKNIRNGIQLQFFFQSMYVLKKYGLLYGPDTTNHKPPLKANPRMIPFFDKHALFVVEKILIPLFKRKKSVVLGKTFK